MEEKVLIAFMATEAEREEIRELAKKKMGNSNVSAFLRYLINREKLGK